MSAIVQRWRARRDSYRPAGEPIRTLDYEVAPIGEAVAKAFVIGHHYSGSYPAARFRFGMFRRGALTGVAVFSHPVRDEVLTRVFPTGSALDSVELGRFVLLDEVPANGETWFLGQAFAELRREGLIGVLSMSDPVARTSASGRRTFPGHIGTIYQAHNGAYLGRATARTLRLLPDGSVLSARAISKVRSRERGWRHVVGLLLEHGAPMLDAGADLRVWLVQALASTTRTLRHPGNHRYAWALQRSARRFVAAGGAYPKEAAA